MKPWTLLETKRGATTRRYGPDYGLHKAKTPSGKPRWQVQFTVRDHLDTRRPVSFHFPPIGIANARLVRSILLTRLLTGSIKSYGHWWASTQYCRKLMLHHGWVVEAKGKLALP